jgi:hypothetical protein
MIMGEAIRFPHFHWHPELSVDIVDGRKQWCVPDDYFLQRAIRNKSCRRIIVNKPDLQTAGITARVTRSAGCSHHYWKQRILNTTRNKRWNGKIDTLAADYLNDVKGKMEAYGDRVQFRLGGSGERPNYQVMNAADKKMAFDSNNHLVHPKAGEYVGSNASGVFTLDQIKAAIAGVGIRASAGARVSRVVGSSRTAAVKVKDLVDAEKYEYFKNNRQILPPGIGEHSVEITELMKNGMAAQDAFAEVVKRHF